MAFKAQQILSIGTLVLIFGGIFALRALPANFISSLSYSQFLLLAIAFIAVLDAILPHYIAFQLFQMAPNARASEHSARMVAMKNATDNAKELIKDLTLEYNKVRQANITTELLEITTAQLAVG